MNVVGALAVLLLIVWGALAWLNNYTHHGEAIPVPDLQGRTEAEAEQALSDRGLKMLVIDSVFNDELPRGTVVDQDPASGKHVKEGRKIYITMNAQAPKEINMPDLVNMSKRQALSILEIVGLKLGSIETRPDPCHECVVEQLFRGKPIKHNALIRRGEAITLILGAGSKGAYGDIPNVVGYMVDEARNILHAASFNLGLVNECKGCNTTRDSAFARVYAQAPGANEGSQRPLGSVVDVWLTTDTASIERRSGDVAPTENLDFGQ